MHISLIEEIEAMFYSGLYDKAELLIKENFKNYSSSLDLQLKIIQCNIMIKKGGFREVISLVNEIMKFTDPNVHTNYIFKLHSVHFIAAIKSMKTDKANSIIKILDELVSSDSIIGSELELQYIAKLSYLRGMYYRYIGKHKIALSHYIKSLDLRSQHHDRLLIGETLNHLGITFEALGNYSEAAKNYYESKTIFHQMGDKISDLGISMNFGMLAWQQEFLDEAFINFTNALKLSTELNNEPLISANLTNLGLIYTEFGDFISALENFEKSIQINLKLDDQVGLWKNYSNIGNIYDMLWDLDRALEYHNKGLEITKKIGDNIGNQKNSLNKGRTYRFMNKNREALEIFEHTVAELKEVDNPVILALGLQELVLTSIEMKDNEKTITYLDEIKRVNEENNIERIKHIYKLSEGIYYRSLEGLMNRARALQLFKELIDNENVGFEAKIAAILNLCDILIIEVQVTRSQSDFQEIDQMLEKIESIGELSNSFKSKIDVLVLKSKIAFIEKDPALAAKTLDKALKVAIDNKLNYLIDTVQKEKRYLEDNIIQFKEIFDRGASSFDLENRITEDYIEFINRKFKGLSSS